MVDATCRNVLDEIGYQTLVKTATGVWQVTYNGENRPVRWTQGDTVITMSFDRMGRRVTKNDQRFVYDGYLQVENFHCSTSTCRGEAERSRNLQPSTFIWDPTESVATRPLVWTKNDISSYYAFDGNKNVSEVLAADGSLSAHYEYAPFGALTVSRGEDAAANPWRFSSEYAEADTATVYYNYRHYEPVMGRWMARDPIEEVGEPNIYIFVNNLGVSGLDYRGLINPCCNDLLKKVIKGEDEPRPGDPPYALGIPYSLVNLQWGISAIGNEHRMCQIHLKCGGDGCQSDAQRLGSQGFTGGYAKLVKSGSSFWHTDTVIEVHLCTDNSGRSLKDLEGSLVTLKHELSHANDLCKANKDFECGNFTASDVNAGIFDRRICSEIRAYATAHRGISQPGMTKEEIIKSAQRSVVQGCGIRKEKIDRIDANFGTTLEARVTALYDKCAGGGTGL